MCKDELGLVPKTEFTCGEQCALALEDKVSVGSIGYEFWHYKYQVGCEDIR